jgi:hypothetical protein
MGTLQVLILGVSRYNFEDKDGKKLTGTSVHYVQLSHSNENDKFGYFPAKANLSYDDFEVFRGLKFPLQADADWTLDMSNKRNPVKITGFSDLQNVIID